MATSYLIIGSEEYESQLSEFIHEEAQCHKDDIERGDWAELFERSKRESNCFCVDSIETFLEQIWEEFKEYAAEGGCNSLRVSAPRFHLLYFSDENVFAASVFVPENIMALRTTDLPPTAAFPHRKPEPEHKRFTYDDCCKLRDALLAKYLPEAVSQLFQDYEAHFVLGDSEENGYERYDCTLCDICYHTNENTDYYVQEVTYQGRKYRSDEEAKATLTLADVDAIRAEADAYLAEWENATA